jgi:hypothetical protein
MATEPAAATDAPAAWAVGLVRRTGVAARAALRRRDGRVTAGVVAVGYFLAYGVGIGYLGLRDAAARGVATGSGPVFDVTVASDPLALLTRRVGPFQYEPVALVAAGPVEYLFAPVNAAIGLALAALVGVTIAVSVVARRSPAACRIGAGAGAAAGIPGILSGFACCGPTLLLVIGVQASAGLLAAMQWLLPLSAGGLVATLLWVGSRVDPAAVD